MFADQDVTREKPPAPVIDPDAAGGEAAADSSAALALVVGRNLRRLRTRRGYSLEKFARLSGVSRGMLSQIELGKSMPTIGLLWKIATALNVTFATLTASGTIGGTVVQRSGEAKILSSADGAFRSRALFPYDGERRTEFYELRVAPGYEEQAPAHAPGTTENLVVTAGRLDLHDGIEWQRLATGDSILFDAGLAHAYRNPGEDEAVAYLVMTYVESVG